MGREAHMHLLVTQSLHLIDLLEELLKRRTRPSGDMKWKNGRDYMRLDGTTPQQQAGAG